MESPTYEDRFGWAARHALRAYRPLRRAAKRATGSPLDILVEIRWRLGDEVMAIPIYEALRVRHERCRLSVLCNYPELLEGNPFVDAVNDVRRDPDLYACLRSGPRLVRRIEHYAELAGVSVPAVVPKLYYADWTTPLLDRVERPFVAVCAGASWATKRWPMERWRALCSLLRDSGYGVVELGSEGEQIGVGESLVGKTSVREAACVLRAASLSICCDSGLMHVGLAAGARVLALFGPTDPDILVKDEPLLTPLRVETDCRGCWNRGDEFDAGTCPLNRDSCLDRVTVETVFAAARRILEAEA